MLPFFMKAPACNSHGPVTASGFQAAAEKTAALKKKLHCLIRSKALSLRLFFLLLLLEMPKIIIMRH